MSQINSEAFSEPENQHHRLNIKQFGASGIPFSAKKKTALENVTNILAQRTAPSAKKLQTPAGKSHLPKNNNCGFENKIINKEFKKQVPEVLQTTEAPTTSLWVQMNKADTDTHLENVEPICSFCDKVEDDYADILFKTITLTKKELDKLASEWERPPIVSEDDIRKIEIPEIPYNEELMDFFLYEHNNLDFSLLDDIPAVEPYPYWSAEE